MDSLSIATDAIDLSVTCFEAAKAIYKYVEEVKEIDKVVALLAQEISLLSKVLLNVHDVLKKHGPSLSTKLGDESSLLDSLYACLNDCQNTVNKILAILNKGQTHGRIGQSMGRIATHWKITEKTKELSDFQIRVKTFHTSISANLQMIQVCLSVRIQRGTEAKHEDVQNSISQLRREIETLTRLEQNRGNRGTHSVADTMRRSSGAAIVLDKTANTTAIDSRWKNNLSMGSQRPSEKVWMQTSHVQAQRAPSTQGVISETVSKHGNFHTASKPPQQPFTSNSLSQRAEEGTAKSYRLEDGYQHRHEIQRSQELLNRGQIEDAKAVCRKLIHKTEMSSSVSQSIHLDALKQLAYIYEHTGDKEAAARVRLLQDMPGCNSIRRDFKELIRTRNLRNCINFALQWSALLHDRATLNLYRNSLEGLATNGRFSEVAMFATICILGNGLFAQLLLSQGASIHEQIHCNWLKERIVTPLGCAIHFGHRQLVQTLIEVASDDIDSIIDTKCLEIAINTRNVEMIRTIFDHLLLLQTSLHKGHMNSNRFVQVTPSQKLRLGELLSKRSRGLSENPGELSLLTQALCDSVYRKDLAMTKLLLEYGVDHEGIVRYATAAKWPEGVQLLAAKNTHVSEKDVYALKRTAASNNYSGPLKFSPATQATTQAPNKSIPLPDKVKARGGFRSLWSSRNA